MESNWAHVEMAPPDPIIGVTEAWRADPDPRKLNLGVGAYRTEEGKPLVLACVREAEAQLMADPNSNHEYLPIAGNAEFCRLARTLALGGDCPALQGGRVATVQALSGEGAGGGNGGGRRGEGVCMARTGGGGEGRVATVQALSIEGAGGVEGGRRGEGVCMARTGGGGEGRVATVQALSGTGALRVGAEFLAAHLPSTAPRVVYLPSPTWGNHKTIFAKAGFQVREYRYFDAATRGLAFDGMCADLASAPRGAVLLLHACAHNPTGVDPSPQQWARILALAQEKALLPFFDSAYQGFASGDLDADAASLRLFVRSGLELVLAQSFAKNMGLYGERAGALSVVCKCKDTAGRVESQLKMVIRPMYSNPPMHGAAIAAKVLGDARLREMWRVELKGMAERIISMRRALYDALYERNVPGDWSFVLKQIGMFSYTGLSRVQCQKLVNKWHIHLTLDGRISMAGLSAQKAPYLADAIADVVANPQ
ncbi:hypothetical protein HYH03_016367 [Edaphochlamys debaryana]|uniref:Aspartate aminotransferase n=1 Tax=Edaphochlamys debaryana TaxID=47281 RepID=A0A836BQ04_9CHLO|nr:hypothetical protein HYH03_016367 [Edaphochlamys debaryana]|eukprot:KAG2484886.1 hypothetical protein HYH03_016367 [Edaphochlamys debaryana]